MNLSNPVINDKAKNFHELIFTKEINFHDITHFKQRIYLEKRRAERSGYTFSVILINWANLYQSYRKQDKVFKLSKILQDIISRICKNIRETDSVSLCHEDRIIILLPDTSNEQAELVLSRLKFQLTSNPRLENPATRLMQLSNICILTYPLGTDCKTVACHSETEKRTTSSDMCSFIKKLLKEQDNYFLESNNIVSSGLHIDANGNSLIMSRIDSFETKILKKIERQIRLIFKRIFDIVGALVGLIITSPIIAVVALLIKVTSRGPILFKQQRIGYKGKNFLMLKFRSMQRDASNIMHKEYISKLLSGDIRNKNNEDRIAKYKHQIDLRITSIGRFIRKTSIDELPQLLNVLLGNMSLVGPRPHPIYEVELYEDWYYRRLLVKPGLTGLSKLNLRCTPEDYKEAMRYDIRYVDQWSLKQDLKIIFKTIPSLFLKNGAY